MLIEVLNEFTEALSRKEKDEVLNVVKKSLSKGVLPEDFLFKIAIPILEALIQSVNNSELPKIFNLEQLQKSLNQNLDDTKVKECCFLSDNIGKEATEPQVSEELIKTNGILEKTLIERKKIEDALIESEENFRVFFEESPVATVLSEISSGKIVAANQRFFERIGLSREEVIGKNGIDLGLIKCEEDQLKLTSLLIQNNGRVDNIEVEVSLPGDRREIELLSMRLMKIKGMTYTLVMMQNITELKLTAKALKESEELYRSLENTIPDAITISDLNGVITFVSPKVFEIFDIDKNENVIGRNVMEWVAPEDQVKVAGYFKDRLIGVLQPENQFELLKGKGEIFFGEINSASLHDADGNIKGIVFATRDITERKKVENELRKTNILLGRSQEMVQIGYWELDLKKGTVWASAQAKAIYGYNEAIDKITIKDIQKIVLGEYREMLEEKLNGLVNKSQKYEAEFKIQRKNNDEIIDIYSTAIYNPIEEKVLGVIQDITERRKTESKVNEANALLTSVLESSPDVIVYALDKNYCYLAYNSKHREIMEHIWGKNIRPGANMLKDVIGTLNDQQKAEANFKRVLAGESFSIIEQFGDKNISKRFWQDFFSPIYSKDNKIIGLTCYALDITRQVQNQHLLRQRENLLKMQNKEYLALNEELSEYNLRIIKINEELINAKEKAEDADRLKSAFLANMSHEVRTPMNGIMGYAELIKRGNIDNEKQIKYADVIYNSSKRLLRIINDILDISKIEAGQMNIIEEQTSLKNMMDNLYNFFIKEARLKKIKLLRGKELPAENSIVLIDSTRLEQIISNLIDNAIKFTNKGYVEFGYNVENKKLKFYVKDSGIGITEEKKQIVFERFRQAEETLNHQYGGNGLGLSISKGLAELMGGKIWVESNENKGSIFYVTMPYKLLSIVEEKQITMTKTQDVYSDKVILLVEDDDFSAEYIKEILLPTRAEIILSRNGIDAIEKSTANNKIKLVLMDIRIPGMNGLDATEKIKKIRPDLPIIAQTANAMTDDRDKCLKAGCDEYIRKPIEPIILLEMVSKYLSGK